MTNTAHIRAASSRPESEILVPVCQPFSSSVLRIVAFSDYGVQDLSFLVKFIEKLRPQPNLILYAGDDLDRFYPEGENFLEQLASLSTHGLCAVRGNDGGPNESSPGRWVQLLFKEIVKPSALENQPPKFRPDAKKLRAAIRGRNVYNVHVQPLVIGPYAVIGSEGSPHDHQFLDLGGLTYSEANIARHLRRVAEAVNSKPLIVLSHCPPRNVLDRAIRHGERHIGSTALRKFIAQRKNVPLVVCGHVHSCGAQTQKLNRCTIVNAASHDRFGDPGRIAVLELQAGWVRAVNWHYLRELGSVSGVADYRCICSWYCVVGADSATCRGAFISALISPRRFPWTRLCIRFSSMSQQPI